MRRAAPCTSPARAPPAFPLPHTLYTLTCSCLAILASRLAALRAALSPAAAARGGVGARRAGDAEWRAAGWWPLSRGRIVAWCARTGVKQRARGRERALWASFCCVDDRSDIHSHDGPFFHALARHLPVSLRALAATAGAREREASVHPSQSGSVRTRAQPGARPRSPTRDPPSQPRQRTQCPPTGSSPCPSPTRQTPPQPPCTPPWCALGWRQSPGLPCRTACASAPWTVSSPSPTTWPASTRRWKALSTRYGARCTTWREGMEAWRRLWTARRHANTSSASGGTRPSTRHAPP